MRVLCEDTFYHDGRGPTLVHVHLAEGSAHLLAIDYVLPDSDGSLNYTKHLLFRQVQAYMFTPEEVENYPTAHVDWSETGRGALVSLGRSAWLASFSQRHLHLCEHYRAMFYDELLDVICEGVTCEPLHFVPVSSKPLKPYQVVVWAHGSDKPGLRDVLQAPNIEAARFEAQAKYGIDAVFTLYNEEDADRIR